ncbi:MAG: nucleotide exchange factor GrpE [Thermoclostridium sp.]|nr:nucleotide exchange factor GrpE [Thermoclostridium sp.]
MKKTGKEKELEQAAEQEQIVQDIQETEPENSETAELENQLEKKGEEIKELKDQLQRLAAEFDNYKKRTVKEKERLYASSVADVAAAFIPVVDNIELALKASESGENGIRDGVQLICRQIEDVLANLKVKPIETIGEEFNPELHEAVMHVEDDSFGDNEIIEEFRKGYIYKDEIVIRHSVVKVAN